MIDKKKIRILYLGTPELSAKVLEKLIINGYNIIGVIAQCDKEMDRKHNLIPVPTKVIAEKYNIKVYQKEKIRLDYEFIKGLNVDLILTLAYGQIIPHGMLEIPKLGCLNLHGSLLPKYRGAAPIQFSLLNGDKITGVTLMKMVDEMDAGTMYYKVPINIEEDDNCTSLTEKMVDACYQCFDEGISDVINDINKGTEQNINEVTFTHKITKDMEVIDFNMNGEQIKNLARALNNAPGIYFVYMNEKIKVYSLDFKQEQLSETNGTILRYDEKQFWIKCNDGYVIINKLQRPGKKVLNLKEFYLGKRDFFKVNDIIK